MTIISKNLSSCYLYLLPPPKQEVKELDPEKVFGNGGLDLESVDFEICRVIFSRSWLDEHLLLSRFWDYPDGLVASGEKDKFEGLLPAYPIEFILVKNVSPLLVPDSPLNEPFLKSLRQGEPVFVGPFMISNTQAGAGQGKPLQVQTFTSRQLSTITNALATSSGGVAVTTEAAPRRKAVQLLRRVQAGVAGVAEVRDHRGGREPAIAAPVLRRPVVRDHRGTPPVGTALRAGHVWVNDHWERERAEPPQQPKITGSIVDQKGHPIANAEITLLAGSVLQNDMSEENGGFAIENVSPGDYHLTAKKDGYSIAEREVKVARAIDVGKINLSSKNPVESYLLLGVVYRKLAKLPNPIEGASYF